MTLETTPGGRIIDGWNEINKGYAWNASAGDPPWARDLWKAISKEYADAAIGNVNLIQTPDKL